MNRQYLFLPTDLQISTISLWRIHVRKYLPPVPKFNHHGLYFKHRRVSKKETSSHMIRRLFFEDHLLDSVTVIVQNNNNILYSAPNLHSTPHASLEIDTLSSLSKHYQSTGVRLSILSNENADNTGLGCSNGINVAFPHHNQLLTLSYRITGGLE